MTVCDPDFIQFCTKKWLSKNKNLPHNFYDDVNTLHMIMKCRLLAQVLSYTYT